MVLFTITISYNGRSTTSRCLKILTTVLVKQTRLLFKTTHFKSSKNNRFRWNSAYSKAMSLVGYRVQDNNVYIINTLKYILCPPS
jgi:hypothetical protein